MKISAEFWNILKKIWNVDEVEYNNIQSHNHKARPIDFQMTKHDCQNLRIGWVFENIKLTFLICFVLNICEKIFAEQYWIVNFSYFFLY